MKRIKVLLAFSALFVFFFLTVSASIADKECTEQYGSGEKTFVLATGSPGELGLLKVLAEEFNKEHGTSMCWKKAGSGVSLKLLKDKKVDTIMRLMLKNTIIKSMFTLSPPILMDL